jgi:hypothetical protein
VKALAFLLVLLILCVDGWGCAGHAGDAYSAEPPSEPEEFGWCCDGLCGLSGEQADLFEQCFCVGAERPRAEGGYGECVEIGTP